MFVLLRIFSKPMVSGAIQVLPEGAGRKDSRGGLQTGNKIPAKRKIEYLIAVRRKIGAARNNFSRVRGTETPGR